MRKKRGRPPNPLAQRRQTTRAGRAGVQTNEPLKEKRVAQHGMAEVGTDSPLDILAAKGLLAPGEPERNAVMRDVGRRLAELHGRIHGPSTARAQDPNRAPKGHDAEPGKREERQEAEYQEMRSCLQALPRRQMDAVYNVAVYGRAPRTLEDLRAGLAALADRNQPRVISRPMRAERALEAVA